MTISFKIPAINKSHYSDKEVPLIKNKMDNVIDKKYGDIINNISNLTNLNKDIIKSFIFIESGGKADAQSPYATGLMQVSTSGASDSLVKEKSSGRLTEGEEKILAKYLGSRMKKLENLKTNQKSVGLWITKNDLLKPELNILIGSIIIKQLIDEFTENGVPKLEKVAVLYNAGRYGKIGKMTIAHKGSIDELHDKLPREPKAYITKLLGVNSTLDILT